MHHSACGAQPSSVMTHLQYLLSTLGFRFAISGAHAARTMMLNDLRLLMAHTAANARRPDYAAAVVTDNVLGKPTQKARQLALRHLVTLYGLDPANPLFRALRQLWPLNESAQPLLAFAVALARDPLLRATQAFFLSQPLGSTVHRERVEQFLRAAFADRFSPASLTSFAQNISGTWTAAGLLQGRTRKIRVIAPSQPESLAFLLFLSYLEGRTDQRLFTSDWLNLLGCAPDELETLARVFGPEAVWAFK
ncbi:MAG TPA: hypothetical protein PLE42_04080, partial [Candidatus Competibacteraceae bacterium]|nr:hypothetical protein [Candidatus Competibacteraceae bacterium]